MDDDSENGTDQPPKEVGYPEKTGANQEHRDEQGPVSINIVQHVGDADQPEKKAPKPYRDWYDKSILGLVIVGFFAALAAAIFTWWEGDIANKALDLAKKTTTAQIRAYVSVRTFPEIWGIPGAPHTRVDLFNGGVTPATNVVVRGALGVRETDPPIDGFATLPVVLPIDIIEASNEFPILNIFRMDRGLTDRQHQDVDTRTRKIFVWGAVEYEDVLEKSHHTYFCFSFHGFREYTNEVPAVNNGIRAGNRATCDHPKND